MKEINKKEILKFIIECLGITLGTFVMAFGYTLFLTPHNIVPGGFMGLAQIIYHLLEKIGFTFITVSLWYIILNAVIFLFAVKSLGVKFGLRVAVGILTYSLFVEVISKMSFISTVITQFESEAATLSGVGVYILYAIYGGVLMGAGMGLVFRFNGSTGGSDMVAVVMNKFFPTITAGQIVLAIDGFVVVCSAIAYQSLVLPLFALITIFICSKVADIFVDGVKALRAYYILTDKKDEMAEEIMTKIGRGVTNINCEGMYTKNNKDMLLVIVRRSQIMQLKNIVKKIDPQSFMFSSLVKEAYGNGFIMHSEKKGLKLLKNGSKNALKDENANEKLAELNALKENSESEKINEKKESKKRNTKLNK